MKEFGSDFHFIDSFSSVHDCVTDIFQNRTLLASGRQCIVALIRQNGWRRLWIPDYFCYEVIKTINKQTGIKVMTYPNNPIEEENVEKLPYEEGDVLLRINYFGMSDFRSNKNIPIAVIEDHSHDMLGHWASNSDADWCISSIRKILPLPEGGMIWSPKGHSISNVKQLLGTNEKIATIRWEAMKKKTAYLNGENVNKNEFREKYLETEKWFDTAEPALIDKKSREYITKQFDLNRWFDAKRRNWNVLKDIVRERNCQVMTAEHKSCTMFSFVLLMANNEQRETVRKRLIENSIYPAVLWTIPDSASKVSRDFSARMLSIHCDGRYTDDDIRQMADIINKSIEEL